MKSDSTIILSTTYLGPISYFAKFLHAKSIVVDVYEHYLKQTYRNRCRLSTATGTLDLSIPVIKVNGNHTRVKDLIIAQIDKWQLIHWRAIVSSYSNSPYFLYYREELEPFYKRPYSSLLDFNTDLFKLMLSLIEMDNDYRFSSAYMEWEGSEMEDHRHAFSPKFQVNRSFPEYQQVFIESQGFQPDLSILDLLCNLGPDTKGYLENIV